MDQIRHYAFRIDKRQIALFNALQSLDTSHTALEIIATQQNHIIVRRSMLSIPVCPGFKLTQVSPGYGGGGYAHELLTCPQNDELGGSLVDY
jgi:hypothetical protein